MNIELLAKQFWAQGYIAIDGFFADSLMDNYQAQQS